MLGGQSVGVAGVPILNPLLTLSAFNFDVFKVRPEHSTQCRVSIIVDSSYQQYLLQLNSVVVL